MTHFNVVAHGVRAPNTIIALATQYADTQVYHADVVAHNRTVGAHLRDATSTAPVGVVPLVLVRLEIFGDASSVYVCLREKNSLRLGQGYLQDSPDDGSPGYVCAAPERQKDAL